MLMIIVVSVSFFLLFLSVLPGIVFSIEEEWIEYEDPEGKFSLEYPANWIIKSKESMFDLHDLQIYDKNPVLQNDVTIGISYKLDADMGDDKVDKFVKHFGQTQMNTNPSYRVVKNDINNYEINGHKASGYIFEQKKPNGALLNGLILVSFPNDQLFSINYSGIKDTFEENLQTVEKIIDSIQILK